MPTHEINRLSQRRADMESVFYFLWNNKPVPSLQSQEIAASQKRADPKAGDSDAYTAFATHITLFDIIAFFARPQTKRRSPPAISFAFSRRFLISSSTV